MTTPLQPSLARLVTRHRAEILAAISRHHASNPRLFGSAARGEDRPESDLDILVDLAPGVGLFGLSALELELAAILGVAVDVVPARALKPQVEAAVLADAIPI